MQYHYETAPTKIASAARTMFLAENTGNPCRMVAAYMGASKLCVPVECRDEIRRCVANAALDAIRETATNDAAVGLWSHLSGPVQAIIRRAYHKLKGEESK